MRIHNLYTDAKGESHFRDIEIALDQSRPPFSMFSKTMPATGIIFRRTDGAYDLDWHPAPRRQYIADPLVTNRQIALPLRIGRVERSEPLTDGKALVEGFQCALPIALRSHHVTHLLVTDRRVTLQFSVGQITLTEHLTDIEALSIRR